MMIICFQGVHSNYDLQIVKIVDLVLERKKEYGNPPCEHRHFPAVLHHCSTLPPISFPAHFNYLSN